MIAGATAMIAAAALAIGGCGTSGPGRGADQGGNPPAGTSTAKAPGGSLDTSGDPCKMLTSSQVAKAIGMKVSAGTPKAETLSDSHDCSWSTAYGQGAAYVCAKDVTGVVLEVVAPPQALKARYPTASAYFADLGTTFKQSGASVTPVSGIGDEAFAVVSATKKGLNIYATKGNVILRVFSICGRPATLQPELEGLLSAALSKA